MDSDYRGTFMEGSVRWKGFNFPSASFESPSWSRLPPSPKNSDSMALQYGQSFRMMDDSSRLFDRSVFGSSGLGSGSRIDRSIGWRPSGNESRWNRQTRPQSMRQRQFNVTRRGARGKGNRNQAQNMGFNKGNGKRFAAQQKNKKNPRKAAPSVSSASKKDTAPEAEKVGNGEVNVTTETKADGQKEQEKTKDAQNGNANKSNENYKKPQSKRPRKDYKSSDADSSSVAEATPNDEKDNPVKTPQTTFTCFVCSYKTEDEIEVQKHFKTSQHREIIKLLYSSLPKKRVDFIQEYLSSESKKVAKEREELKMNESSKKDSFRGIGQEHFLHRIEAAHCFACNILIPDVPAMLRQHVKSKMHSQNRRAAHWDIKNKSVSKAKELLQFKSVKELLQKYMKGDNPFPATETTSTPEEDLVADLVAEEDDVVPMEDMETNTADEVAAEAP
ncbi:uncharacterized protein WCC33_005716 [Rhinophrynus dorsalis]